MPRLSRLAAVFALATVVATGCDDGSYDDQPDSAHDSDDIEDTDEDQLDGPEPETEPEPELEPGIDAQLDSVALSDGQGGLLDGEDSIQFSWGGQGLTMFDGEIVATSPDGLSTGDVVDSWVARVTLYAADTNTVAGQVNRPIRLTVGSDGVLRGYHDELIVDEWSLNESARIHVSLHHVEFEALEFEHTGEIDW